MNSLPSIVQNCKTAKEISQLADSLNHTQNGVRGRRFSLKNDSETVSIADLRERLQQIVSNKAQIHQINDVTSALSKIDTLNNKVGTFSKITHLFSSIITGNWRRSNVAVKQIANRLNEMSSRNLLIDQAKKDCNEPSNTKLLDFLTENKFNRQEIKEVLFDKNGKARKGALDLAKIATKKQQGSESVDSYMRGNSVNDNIRNVYAQTLAEKWILDTLGEIDLEKNTQEIAIMIYEKLNSEMDAGTMPQGLKELLSTVQETSEEKMDPSFKETHQNLLKESNLRFFIFSVLNPVIMESRPPSIKMATLTSVLTQILSTPEKTPVGISDQGREKIAALQKELLAKLNA